MGDDDNQGATSVYNLSKKSIRKYITEGSRVMLGAGYQGICF